MMMIISSPLPLPGAGGSASAFVESNGEAARMAVMPIASNVESTGEFIFVNVFIGLPSFKNLLRDWVEFYTGKSACRLALASLHWRGGRANNYSSSAGFFFPRIAVASSSTSDRSCGIMARQGPHQNPQKSSITTLPR